ncbi:carbohydrate kinase family protein [Adhaeretor mobilis]|uniref:Uncharacterized protein n=1 Tax=Adhaeretor mobilis TaxID=1930276 RepID=A0A517MR05_9BACT|nr:carbohydrate kinase family protein [Adhaeretor mobilis]QDS97217.1 hypothetical protein HG15A2_04770 [Adhaeretor mobilis]
MKSHSTKPRVGIIGTPEADRLKQGSLAVAARGFRNFVEHEPMTLGLVGDDQKAREMRYRLDARSEDWLLMTGGVTVTKRHWKQQGDKLRAVPAMISQKLPRMLAGCDWWYVQPTPGSDLSALREIMVAAKESGTKVYLQLDEQQIDSVDEVIQLASQADFVQVDETTLRELAAGEKHPVEALAILRERGLHNIVATLGPAGVLGLDEGEWMYDFGWRVKKALRHEASSVFGSIMVASLAEQRSPDEAILKSNKAAAAHVSYTSWRGRKGLDALNVGKRQRPTWTLPALSETRQLVTAIAAVVAWVIATTVAVGIGGAIL